MRSIRFIHCADLHIDSPFKGITEIHPHLKELLYQSTFDSYKQIIEIAIREKVDCVLIAGDIFDGADKSLQAQLKFRNGLQRLADESIPSFIVHGNHDPLDSWSATLKWSDMVKVFSGDKVECVSLKRKEKIIAYIYGISYKTRDIKENLSLKYKRKDTKIPAIGLLHANVGINTGHESYAPATKDDLISQNMDYWALGHVHNFQIVNESNPVIVYPGNSQARNPRERGNKGCCLVNMHSNGDCDIDFIPTDVVRYELDELDISECTTIDEIVTEIVEKSKEISSRLDGRHAILRLSLVGNTDLHSELTRGGNIGDITEHVRENFKGVEPFIWLEKLKLNTKGKFDLVALKSGNNLVADIISLYEELKEDESELWNIIDEKLDPLFKAWSGSNYLRKITREELAKIAEESRNLTIEKIIEGE